MAVRSDHSIDNGDEDCTGQDHMVGSWWCCRTCGGKKETKEIMMMLIIQIHCTDTEILHICTCTLNAPISTHSITGDITCKT